MCAAVPVEIRNVHGVSDGVACRFASWVKRRFEEGSG